MQSNKFIIDNINIGISNFLLYIKGIIIIPILVKIYNEDIYGSYIIITSVVMFIFQTSSIGVFYNYRRFLPSTENYIKRKTLFYNQFIPHFFLLIFASIFVAIYFNNLKEMLNINNDLSIFYFYLFLLLFFFYNQFNNYFRLSDRMMLFSVNQLLYPYLSAVLMYMFSFWLISINSILIAHSIVLLILTLLLFHKLKKEIGITNFSINIFEVKKNISKGYPLVLHYFVDFFLSISDRFFIAAYMGVTAVSIYNPAYTLASLIIFIPKVFGIVLQPHLSREKDRNASIITYSKASKSIRILFFVGIPFIFGSAILSKQILLILANANIAKNGFYLVPFISIGIVAYGVNIVMGTILFVEEKTIEIFRGNIIAVILNVSGNLILLYFLRNLLVPALLTSISYSIATIYLHHKTKKVFTNWFKVGEVVKFFMASLIMSILLYLFILYTSIDGILLVIILTIMGIFIYILTVYLFLNNNERKFYFSLISFKRIFTH